MPYHRMALLLSPNNSRWLCVHLGVGVVPVIAILKFVSVKLFLPIADAVANSQTPSLQL